MKDTGWNDPSVVPMYEWQHVAFVWDLEGISGSADRMRIYRDGILIGSNTDPIADIMFDNGVVKLLGHHEYRRYNQPTTSMDNIKVWDYAKTDFSDRFVEGFNQSPVAEANGPYDVTEGGTVTLTGSGSHDPDAGDTLTYAWDLDDDGLYGETGPAATHGDEVGIQPTFSAAGLDGPGSVTVSLRVTDQDGLSGSDAATVDVTNVLPAVDPPTVTPEPSAEGSAATASATFSDPGAR